VSGIVIELKAVERHYVQGERKLTILNKAELALKRGEIVALVAPSARASRRCCISRACSSGRMPAR
jgi:predicted ABC-type transport system involved in lysophospholipase L1 biosynthesis ATPase subunit